MYKEHRIGVVVPVYNEAEFIADVVRGVPAFVDRVYVVDDCSTDGTWAEIRRQQRAPEPPAATTPDGGTETASRLVATQHADNRGRGGAVKTGYRMALGDSMDVVAVMDGDGQMDPAHLDRLLDPIVDGVADYTKGNRLRTAHHRAQMSRFRVFGNVLLTGLTRVASGYWGMTDPQNGYTAISANALSGLDVGALYDRYGFLNDVLVRLNANDAHIVDVPMPARYGDEESGIRYRTFVPRLSLLLFRRFLWRLRVAGGPRGGGAVAGLYGLTAVLGATGLISLPVLLVAGLGRFPGTVPSYTLAFAVILGLVAMTADWLDNRRLVSDWEDDGTAE